MREIRRFQLDNERNEQFAEFTLCRRTNRLLAVPSSGPLQLFSLGDGSRIWTRACGVFAGMKPYPGLLTVAFSQDGDTILAISSADERLHLIDARTGPAVRWLQLPDVAGNDCHAARIDASGRFVVLRGCDGTACFSLSDGATVWKEFGREECCSDSLHVTRHGHVVFSDAYACIQIRSVASGVLQRRFRGALDFVVSEDESQVVCYEHGQGFTRFSLATGESSGHIPFEPAVVRGVFDWSSRRSRIVVGDDSHASEQLLVIDLQTGKVIDTGPFPDGDSCWGAAFAPLSQDTILAVGEACIVYEFRL
jgi:outer membrane protein assembly factor BamB